MAITSGLHFFKKSATLHCQKKSTIIAVRCGVKAFVKVYIAHLKSHLVLVWRTLSENEIVELYYLVAGSIMGKRYKNKPWNYTEGKFLYLDDAPPHYAVLVSYYLYQLFPNRRIERSVLIYGLRARQIWQGVTSLCGYIENTMWFICSLQSYKN